MSYDDEDGQGSVLPDYLDQALTRMFPAGADPDTAYKSREAREVLWRVLPYIEDATDVVDALLPYDGPHSRDTVVDAARVMAAAGRYLNNATQQRHTVPWGQTIGNIVGSTKTTLFQLDQLLKQLAAAALRLTEDPGLYSDQTPYDRTKPREEWQRARHADGITSAMKLADQLNQVRAAIVTWQDYRPVSGVAVDLEQPHALANQIGTDTPSNP